MKSIAQCGLGLRQSWFESRSPSDITCRYRCVFSIFMVAGIIPIFPRVTSPTNASTPTWAVECRLSMDGAPQSARVACCRMEVAMAAAVGDLPVVHEAREAAPIVDYRRKRFSAPSQKASRNRRITTRKLRSFVTAFRLARRMLKEKGLNF
jgi:hypothetical protein